MNLRAERRVRAPRVTVSVQHQAGGRWEVAGPDQQRRIACETLDDARRIAYLAVAHTHGCELIVRDAYNRILEHALID